MFDASVLAAGASLFVVTAVVEVLASPDESVVAVESQLSELSVVLDVLDESAGVAESASVAAEPVAAAALTVTNASLAVAEAAGLLVAWLKLWCHMK